MMDHPTFFVVLFFISTFIYVLTTGRRKPANAFRLPPGPRPLPVVGNIFKLGSKPHHSLASLSKTYGPLMTLKLGAITTIVVSSPQTAKEFFLKHDLAFSSRSVPDTGRAADHHLFSMVWLPVGDQWRRLRRISKEHLFSVQQLDSGESLRRKKIKTLLDYVHQCCTSGRPVNISRAAFTTSLNVLSSFVCSTDMAHFDSVASKEFKDTVSDMSVVAGKPNLSDFFPVLKPLDPQGLLREGNIYSGKLIKILGRMVEERVELRAVSGGGSSTKDVLDLLLDLSGKNESEFSRNDMLHLLMDIFAAATETTTSTLEWAMAELLKNPKKMAKARSELKKIVKEKNTSIEESDISKLPYLHAVVKETLRLHPPVPFLIPHKALHDVEVEGFIVPKDAQILCNVWAIGRDPIVWSEPQRFEPERFLGSEIDYMGRDFELIPFGSGRRVCPGLPLAHRMLHMMLGSLICEFEWKLEGEMRPEDLDMSEKVGITLQKKVPLMAVPMIK